MPSLLLMIMFFCMLVQLGFEFYFFLPFGRNKNELTENDGHLPVSIVICAHNESANLKKNLPLILNQDYDNFEVIVMLDHCQDDSILVLQDIIQKYDNLKVMQISDNIPGKKNALKTGIENAINDWVLLTDADCFPISEYWIKTMMEAKGNKKQIVLGFAPMKREKVWFNKWARYDTVRIALNYLSFAERGIPYMGVGRNMLYARELFLNSNDFKLHQEILSGDDDLFINRVGNEHNLAVTTQPDAQMFSTAKNDFISWYRQKSRHLLSSHFYGLKTKILLAIQSTSAFLFYLTILAGFFHASTILIVLFVFVVWTFIQIAIFGKALKRLGSGNLIVGLPLFELIYVFYPIIFLPGYLLKKGNQWHQTQNFPKGH
jgi:poly-beta-1,6-N-acetyl-D-glucosamine synthase